MCCVHYFVTLTVILVAVKLGCCFNLETRIPVIKEGPTGSYFGYSVAQHQLTNEDGIASSV
ncbi:hypothetical protein X975_10596, partial [Stegodyphus mimosarum]